MDWQAEIVKKLEQHSVSVRYLDPHYIMNEHTVHFVNMGQVYPETKLGDLIIHEDLFHSRRKSLYNRLYSKMHLNTNRIFGRKTQVRIVDRATAQDFMNDFHLLGYCGGKTHLGLYAQDTLVALAIFSAPRHMKYENPTYYSTELERFVTRAGTTVVGGLSKLIEHYCKMHPTDDLVTTIDKEWSDGSAFQRIGFEFVNETPPLLFQMDPETLSRKRLKVDSATDHTHLTVRNQGNIKLRKWIHLPR